MPLLSRDSLYVCVQISLFSIISPQLWDMWHVTLSLKYNVMIRYMYILGNDYNKISERIHHLSYLYACDENF